MGPVHPDAVGVTEKLATIGRLDVSINVNGRIFPDPVSIMPMLGWSFCQKYPVPGIEPEKLTESDRSPLHLAWLGIGFTFGSGFIVTMNESDVMLHCMVSKYARKVSVRMTA